MDIVGVNDKGSLCCIGTELAHSIKVDQEGQKDFVGSGTILEYPQKVGFEGDGRDIPRMKSES